MKRKNPSRRQFSNMCTHHLRDKQLSLKAKGLHSIMLSLPDTWQYSCKGLASLSSDGIKSVESTLAELEAKGYLKRDPVRNEKGQFVKYEYEVYEVPVVPQEGEKSDEGDHSIKEEALIGNDLCSVSPGAMEPVADRPVAESPQMDFGTQYNYNKNNTNAFRTNESLSEERVMQFIDRPTLDEVCAYIRERNSKVSPQRFHSYYAARGWKGIVNWRALVESWEGMTFKEAAKKDQCRNAERGSFDTDDFAKAAVRHSLGTLENDELIDFVEQV